MDFKNAHRACVAPMMQYTDMHDRISIKINLKTYILIYGDDYHRGSNIWKMP